MMRGGYADDPTKTVRRYAELLARIGRGEPIDHHELPDDSEVVDLMEYVCAREGLPAPAPREDHMRVPPGPPR